MKLWNSNWRHDYENIFITISGLKVFYIEWASISFDHYIKMELNLWLIYLTKNNHSINVNKFVMKCFCFKDFVAKYPQFTLWKSYNWTRLIYWLIYTTDVSFLFSQPSKRIYGGGWHPSPTFGFSWDFAFALKLKRLLAIPLSILGDFRWFSFWPFRSTEQ